MARRGRLSVTVECGKVIGHCLNLLDGTILPGFLFQKQYVSGVAC